MRRLRSVGELGDGRCDTGLEPEVRFVFYHVSGEQEREETPCEFVPFETEIYGSAEFKLQTNSRQKKKQTQMCLQKE